MEVYHIFFQESANNQNRYFHAFAPPVAASVANSGTAILPPNNPYTEDTPSRNPHAQNEYISQQGGENPKVQEPAFREPRCLLGHGADFRVTIEVP
jgi:hypothetical protein